MFYRKKLMYIIGARRVRVLGKGFPCKSRPAGAFLPTREINMIMTVLIITYISLGILCWDILTT